MNILDDYLRWLAHSNLTEWQCKTLKSGWEKQTGHDGAKFPSAEGRDTEERSTEKAYGNDQRNSDHLPGEQAEKTSTTPY